MTGLPEFPFDAVVDYEKVAESCDWMCLPEYFREGLVEFVRQLEASGFVIGRRMDTEYGWRFGDVGPHRVPEGVAAAAREVDYINRNRAAAGEIPDAVVVSRPVLEWVEHNEDDDSPAINVSAED